MKVNDNTPITLVMSVEAINTVLASLSAQPYQNVAGIIGSIQQQAAIQLKVEEPAAVDRIDK